MHTNVKPPVDIRISMDDLLKHHFVVALCTLILDYMNLYLVTD